MNSSVIFYLGICTGITISYIIIYLSSLRYIRNEQNTSKKYFNDILESIRTTGKFLSRINNMVEVEIDMLGVKYTVIYIIDKSSISVFLGGDCIRVSSKSDVDVADSIIDEITSRWSTDIDNTMIIGESKFDVKTYERLGGSVVEKKINKDSLSIDGILDRISQVGIDRLTDDEKKYLKKYGN